MNPIEYFEGIASTYLKEHSRGTQDSNDAAYFFARNAIMLHRLIDLGCGPGSSALPFLKLGVRQVIGVDASQKMLDLFTEQVKKEEQRSKLSNVSIKTVLCNFNTEILQIDTTPVDCVLAFGLLNYLSLAKLEILMERSVTLLERGGFFALSLLQSRDDLDTPGSWDGLGVYIHSRKSILSLFSDNKLSVIAEKEDTGLYILKKPY